MKYSSKIHILLPYKESFSYEKAGAVSLYVNEFLTHSKFKKITTVYGAVVKRDWLNKMRFEGIKIPFNSFFSKSNLYLKSYLTIANKNIPKIIEVHNRPYYINFLHDKISSNFILYFHNDPREMSGSKTSIERKFLLKVCQKIIFNSNYTKNCFFVGIDENKYLSKFDIIYNSTFKLKKFPLKKKLITFIGKLNSAKGYDLFVNSLKVILKKFPSYKAIAIGDEPRKKIFFTHKNFKELGFIKNSVVIKYLKKTDIAVIPSKWNEPFGRTSLEATKCGCYTIASDTGGLTETSSSAIFLKNITDKKIIDAIIFAINNKRHKISVQKKSFRNVQHLVKDSSKKIDNIRNSLIKNKKFPKRIINIYNIGARLNYRLYNISIGRKFTSGFVKNGYDVLEISDRDYERNNFNEYLIESIKNYEPSILIFGHSKFINFELIITLKKMFPYLVIIEWNEDYLGKNGPDNLKNYQQLKRKEKLVDFFFVTTDPRKLYRKLKNSYYFPIPVDKNIETNKQFLNSNEYDLFFTLSHGVNRGVLKKNKIDERETVLNFILNHKDIKCNFFGINNIQPIWSSEFNNQLQKCNMGLNLSRGEPVNLYSSNRIASYMGNGLLTFIDNKSGFQKYFTNKDAVFYNGINDLIRKIKFYKKHDSLRKKIAKNGYQTYHKLFNSKKVTKIILDKASSIIKAKFNTSLE